MRAAAWPPWTVLHLHWIDHWLHQSERSGIRLVPPICEQLLSREGRGGGEGGDIALFNVLTSFFPSLSPLSSRLPSLLSIKCSRSAASRLASFPSASPERKPWGGRIRLGCRNDRLSSSGISYLRVSPGKINNSSRDLGIFDTRMREGRN